MEFGLNYFSTLQLLRTLFFPWRRYVYAYPRYFDPAQWFNAFTFNLMSRGIGAMVRMILIGIGLMAELLIVAVGAIIFACWIFLPVIVLVELFVGVAFLL